MTNTPILNTLNEAGEADMRRAFMFGSFLDTLAAPSPAVRTVAAIADLPPPRMSKGDKMRARLLQRDGDECWLCGEPLGDDVTQEHHIPKRLGGTSNINNLVLCHELCNRALAHRTPDEKVALRDATRAANLSKPRAA